MIKNLGANALSLFLLFALGLATSPLQAHFPWLTRDQAGHAVYYFGESPADRTYHLPPSIAEAKIQAWGPAADEGRTIAMHSVDGDTFVGRISEEVVDENCLLTSQVTFGIYHGAKLDYYAIHQCDVSAAARSLDAQQREGLFAKVESVDDGLVATVTWRGIPLPDAKVQLLDASGESLGEVSTNSQGEANFPLQKQAEGELAILVGNEIKETGELAGTPYSTWSNYLTLTFPAMTKKQSMEARSAETNYPPLPEEVTSFGAVRSGDAFYLYGGHTGSAHSYSTAEQSDRLLKLDLDNLEAGWQTIATGRRLQGLGMVTHRDRLILVGGFTALNGEGEEHDLHSQEKVTVYDLKTGAWSELAPLPAGRSSHDAAVLGDTLYVVGGWDMNGEDDTEWHAQALSLDLSDDSAQWIALPEQPFKRRALAVVAHQQKLYVLGGMNEKGGPTRDVEIYDPETQQWSQGPALLGDSPMAGFGAAGWSVDGKLIVTGYAGDIQRLAEDGKSWERIGKSRDARFFHRLLPTGKGLVAVGGANMESGKFLDLEVIR